MHLSIINIIRSWFNGGYGERHPKVMADGDEHVYIKGVIETRGPCPGLNALANQGYLPRDGKNITLGETQRALMTAVHMDWWAAASLTSSLAPLVRDDGTYDLVDTRRHNVIEHDSSFTRRDFCEGDNFTFQPDMLQAMIDDANGGPVTLKSLATTYKRRDKESRAAGAPRLPFKLSFVRMLQAVGVMNVARSGGILTKEVLHAVFVEERLPDVILNNPEPVTLLTFLKNTSGMMRHVIFG